MASQRYARRGSPRFASARMSPRQGPLVPLIRIVSLALAASSRPGAAYGCPGSGVVAPCLWCELGPVGPTLPLRSELAGSGADYGRRRVMRANVCVTAGRRRAPAMSGGAEHPDMAGGALNGGGQSGDCGSVSAENGPEEAMIWVRAKTNSRTVTITGVANTAGGPDKTVRRSAPVAGGIAVWPDPVTLSAARRGRGDRSSMRRAAQVGRDHRRRQTATLRSGPRNA